MPRNRHDAFFKAAFSIRSIVLIYLQKFLDPGIVSRLELSALQKADDSFISGRLLASLADVVWTCSYNSGKLLRICFIFEHKSGKQKIPVFVQLLQYMLNVWRSDIRHKRPLTLPIPIVVHHGGEKWEHKPFHTYFDGINESLKAFIPSFEYVLTDLVQIEKDQLKAKKLEHLFNVFVALKYVSDQEKLLENSKDILNFAEKFLDTEEGTELFEMVLTYFGSFASLETPEIHGILEDLGSKSKKLGMSVWEKIRKEGKIEGKIEGEQEKSREFVTALLKNTDWDNAHIAFIANVPETFVAKLRAELKPAE
jgi:predicted transposase YdaD